MADKFPGRSIFGGININFRWFKSKTQREPEFSADELRISGLPSFREENLHKRVYALLRLFAWWLQPHNVLGCRRVPNPRGAHLCSDIVVQFSSENIRNLVLAHKASYERFFNGTVDFSREKAARRKGRKH